MKKIAAMVVAFVMAGAALAAMAVALDPSDPGDAKRDSDGDGLTNLQEFINGTDPYDPDTDRGGCPDGWEAFYDENRASWSPDSGSRWIQYGWANYARFDSDGDQIYDVNVDPHYHFNPVNRLDENDGSLREVDSDTWSNIFEYQKGTDPTNPDTDGDGWLDDSDPEPLIPDPDGPAGKDPNINGPHVVPVWPPVPGPIKPGPIIPGPVVPPPDPKPDDKKPPSRISITLAEAGRFTNPDGSSVAGAPAWPKGKPFCIKGVVEVYDQGSGSWKLVDRSVGVTVQLNQSGTAYVLWAGPAGDTGDGAFDACCLIPGAAAGGVGKIVIHALGNNEMADCWLTES